VCLEAATLAYGLKVRQGLRVLKECLERKGSKGYRGYLECRVRLVLKGMLGRKGHLVLASLVNLFGAQRSGIKTFGLGALKALQVHQGLRVLMVIPLGHL
jgi:hypothetical protein